MFAILEIKTNLKIFIHTFKNNNLKTECTYFSLFLSLSTAENLAHYI